MAGFKSLTGFDANNQPIINVADPSTAQQAATKAYVDAMSAGLRWKDPVVVASTANVTVSNPGTAVFDGITLTSGDRILLKDQTTAAENGIYVFNGSASALTRSTDANTAAKLNSATVFVAKGTVNSDRGFTQTGEIATLGTDSVVWVQFSSGSSYGADGNGLELSGTTFSLELDGATLSKSATGLRLATGVAGAGLVYNGAALDVNIGTGLEINSDTVRIAAAAAGSGLTGGAGSALAVGAGTTYGGITVNADDIDINPSVVVRKYATSIGNGSATSIAVTHNLNTKDITWRLRTVSDDSFVYTDGVATDVNTLTLTFATAPTTNQYRVIVHG
jgi:hypothetical protein